MTFCPNEAHWKDPDPDCRRCQAEQEDIEKVREAKEKIQAWLKQAK